MRVYNAQETLDPRAATRGGGGILASQLTIFVAGDVMTGRGVDQILPHPSHPRIFEPMLRSALDYVRLAERRSGEIERPVTPDHLWGDALEVIERVRPAARIINLETSVTTSEDAEPKGINYRMHPGNVGILTAAGVDCCVLSNNHVLDWGRAGLHETLETISAAGVLTAGAGLNLAAASAPAIVEAGLGRRVLVFAAGFPDSGIPSAWAAAASRAGVHLLPDFSDGSVARMAELVKRVRHPSDLVVASLHWGGNWGYAVPPQHRRFAHALIDRAAVDLVHGHSSHHPRGMEVHRGKLILYGCGDLLNDYEGITGMEPYRGDLSLLYFPTLELPGGRLRRLTMVPMQIRHMRLHAVSAVDREWMRGTLNREAARFGCGVAAVGDELELRIP